MTARDSNSAPNWDQPTQAPEHTWRRLFSAPNRISKTMPRRDSSIAAQVPTEILTKGNGVITLDNRDDAARSQWSPLVQRLTAEQRLRLSTTELDLLEVIEEHGGIAAAALIAAELEVDAKQLRRKEIHRLHRDGIIRPVHGKGYEMVKK